MKDEHIENDFKSLAVAFGLEGESVNSFLTSTQIAYNLVEDLKPKGVCPTALSVAMAAQIAHINEGNQAVSLVCGFVVSGGLMDVAHKAAGV